MFMLTGLASKWKQIVDYYYTGDDFDGAILKSIIFQIVHKAESIHLHLNIITSDMGPMLHFGGKLGYQRDVIYR